LLRLDDVARTIGDRTLFAHVDLEVHAGDRIGIVGPNGAGKSTLLALADRRDPPDHGHVIVPRNVRVGMLRQEIDPRRATSVRDEAATALAHLDALEAELRQLEAQIAASHGEVPELLAERYDLAHTRFEHAQGYAREARVDAVLEGLGFDADARARPLSSFSGGWLMRVELAKLLLAEPDVLLLDEPTNHLDLPAIQWFESVIANFRGALVVVSHDRTFLRRHVRRVAELDGRGHFDLYEYDYDGYLAERERRRAELLARKSKQEREIAHMEKFVERFRYKATKAKQAQSRLKAIDRIERIEIDDEGPRGPRLRIPDPPRSGRLVLQLEGVGRRFGDHVVYRGLDFQLERGERVALVGPNGAGKSTLLRIAAGTLDIDEGRRTTGHNVEIATFAQHQLEALDESRSVLEEIAADARMADQPRLRGQLGAFLFSGSDADKRVAVLSGGEKARLALAKMLLQPHNLLVLDEPTNHLDMQACEVLEQALADFSGTLLFVSHDRSFLNAVATRIVEVLPGSVRSFPGNYDDYLAKLDAERSKQPPRPPTQPGDGAAPAPARLTREQRQAERNRRKNLERVRRKLERVEQEISELEQEIEGLGHQLGAPEVCRDAARVQEIEARRVQLRGETAAHYSEWEQLASEVEALEDGAPAATA